MNPRHGKVDDLSCVLFPNPGCLLEGDAVDALLHALRSDAKIGMVSGLLLNLNGSEQAVATILRSFMRAFGLARFANRWPGIFEDLHPHKKVPKSPRLVLLFDFCFYVPGEQGVEFLKSIGSGDVLENMKEVIRRHYGIGSG